MAFALCANDVFVYDFNGQPELNEVLNNKVNTIELLVGKSYNLKNNLSLTTGTNATSTYAFHIELLLHKKNLHLFTLHTMISSMLTTLSCLK